MFHSTCFAKFFPGRNRHFFQYWHLVTWRIVSTLEEETHEYGKFTDAESRANTPRFPQWVADFGKTCSNCSSFFHQFLVENPYLCTKAQFFLKKQNIHKKHVVGIFFVTKGMTFFFCRIPSWMFHECSPVEKKGCWYCWSSWWPEEWREDDHGWLGLPRVDLVASRQITKNSPIPRWFVLKEGL